MHGFKENLWLAIGTINANKLRSILTILGVVIGVTCVISIGGILTGFDRSVVAQIESFGVNNIFIEKMDSGPHFGRPSREERMRKPLSFENFEAIKESCTLCRQTLPVIFGDSFAKARY